MTARCGELLVELNFCTEGTINRALTELPGKNTRLLSYLVQKNLLAVDLALHVLCRQAGVPAVNIQKAIIPRAAFSRIPLNVAQKELLLPLRVEGKNLFLAMADPGKEHLVAEVSFITGLSVLPHVALYAHMQELVPLVHATPAPFFVAPHADSELGDALGYLPLVVDTPNINNHNQGLDSVEFDVDVDNHTPVASVQPALLATTAARKRILVVDDEPEIRRLVTAALEPLGHEVISASRGVEALELIRATEPDLIILDAMLPEVHGFEICRKVKESQRFATTPVFMISAIYRGWRIAEDIKATYKADEFFEKPFRIAELRRRVQQLMDQSNTVHAPEQNEKEAIARYQKATEAYKNSEFELAFQELRQAEGMDPFSAKIQFMLGRVLEHRQRHFQAIYHYERAVELQPNLFAATKNLALLYQNKGFRNKAIEMWERSLKAAPTPEIREQIKKHLVSIL